MLVLSVLLFKFVKDDFVSAFPTLYDQLCMNVNADEIIINYYIKQPSSAFWASYSMYSAI